MKTAILAGVTAFAITAATLAIAQPAPSGAQAQQPTKHGMKAPQTRADVAAKVRNRFTALDTNKDGFVTRQESEAAMAARFSQRFDRLDSNKDGQISRDEFSARPERRTEGPRAERGQRGGGRMGFAGRMFDMTDANKDSRVSLQEATDAALRHFDMADANKDGTVTPEERRQMWQTHRQHTPKAG